MFNSTCGRTDLSAHDAQQKGNQMDSQHADHRQPAERHQTGVKEKNELLIRTHLKLEAAMLSTVITSASPTAERKKRFPRNHYSSLTILLAQKTSRRPPLSRKKSNSYSQRKSDDRIYGKPNINPPLAGISRRALYQFISNVFLDELKRTKINASPLAIVEVANGAAYPVTK